MITSDLADKLLSQMTAEDRLVLTLVDGEQRSTKEVAAATGWSESKVKVKAFRARKKMRTALGKLMKKERPNHDAIKNRER